MRPCGREKGGGGVNGRRINRKGKEGGRGGEKGCLSSGQVQLTLNCLALEVGAPQCA